MSDGGAFVVRPEVPPRRDRTGADGLAALAAGVRPEVEVLDYIGEYHPCDVMPSFLPSESDAGGAARNHNAAIQTNPALLVLSYRPRAEGEAAAKDWMCQNGHGTSHPWYNYFDPCVRRSFDTKVEAYDESPYLASNRVGPPPFGTRLQVVPKAENAHEGTVYRSFTGPCPRVANREPFLVVPVIARPAGPPTDYFCGP